MLIQAGSPLEEIDWRLLHWLLRYPLQRADDLAVGVARWASRATVYRHLQGLEASALVESVLPATPGTGKRLYHLSNLGLHVLARHLEKPARELAREFRADEAGLLHLVPRLPTLLVLQEVVNGLVTGAAEAMTVQGRRPRLVRWTWQRDVAHRFLYREQAMRWFVDGALALCIRVSQGDNTMPERWYGLFLLFTALDDERLMRLRLGRLLCWRESPERWPIYQHMPFVLILAGSIRQHEHWQRAVEATALSLRVEPLAGALATLPPSERTHVNPWLLNWRSLATEKPCHLQELLKPLPLSAFPSSLTLQEAGEDERERHPRAFGESAGVPPSTIIPARLSRLIMGDLARRAVSLLVDEPVEQELVALLALRLTSRQWGMLYLLLDHPLLSDQDLAALLALQRKSVRSLLYTLHRLGCLEAITTEVGTRWPLGERGLRLIAAANHFHVRNLIVFGDETAAGTITLKQRGVDWLLERIQHTAGIYRFFAALTEAARRVPGHALCWWETGARCERRYRISEQWYNLRPDALAEYCVGLHQIRFWLEWDRGTMNARDLAVKFASYAQYIASREWAKEQRMLPRLVCIVPDVAQERQMQRVAHAQLAHFGGVEVWTTTEVLLNEYGPFAPIWSLIPQECGRNTQPGDSLRQRLFTNPDIHY